MPAHHRPTPFQCPWPHPLPERRADAYGLLADLLLRVPDRHLLAGLREAPLPAGRSALALAWHRLVWISRARDDASIAADHAALFAGGRRMAPSAAASLTAALAAGVDDGDAHLGSLCRTMQALIAGNDGRGAPERFLALRIAPWYGACLADMREAVGANFYVFVADFAEAFLDLECAACEAAMAAVTAPSRAPRPGAEDARGFA